MVDCSSGRRFSCFPLLAALICLALGACNTPTQVQSSVAQFNQAVTSTATAEDGLFSPATQRNSDLTELCLLGSRNVSVDPGTGAITSTDFSCTTAVTAPDLQAAVDSVMKAVTAYAASLQSLVTDTAGTTFGTNVTALGNSVNSLGTSVFTPLGVKGGLTAAQVSAVGKAVTDIGGALIAFAQSRDAQAAAKSTQAKLHLIATNLTTINNNWSAGGIAANNSAAIAATVRQAWKEGSITDRRTIQTMVANDFGPLPTDKVNKALASMAEANDQIATSGPTVQTTIDAIKTFGQAGSDAVAAVNALKAKK